MTPEKISLAFSVLLAIQAAHSIEELSTGFHRKWYVFTMPFLVFLLWEICFMGFWLFVLFTPDLTFRLKLMEFFNFLMLMNSVQHIVWAKVLNKYVPGLITAPLFMIVFFYFYLS